MISLLAYTLAALAASGGVAPADTRAAPVNPEGTSNPTHPPPAREAPVTLPPKTARRRAKKAAQAAKHKEQS